jgi:geranylgeranylglycerol-phosphate geranylgeranyltransferase
LVGVVATSGVADQGIGVLAMTTGGATAALYGASTVALVGAYRARHTLRDAMAYGTWHLFLLPGSLLAASSPMMPRWMAIVAVAAFVLPPVLFGRAVRGHEFDVPSTTLPTRASAVAPAAPRLAGLWEMTRPGTPLAAAALVAAGAWVSGDVSIRVVPLMAATALTVAAANVFNDRCDVPADAINRPDRPLIAGPTTGNDADKFVLGASVAAVALAATLDNPAALATALLLSFGLAYSLFLRRVAFVGQAAVAGLFAAPLLYGGAFAAGGLTYRTWIAFGVAVLYVFGREVMKGIPDRPGDIAAGYRSPATVLGGDGALRLYRVAAVTFCVASLGVTVIVEDPLYLAASIAFAVGPTIRTMLMVRGRPSTSEVESAIAFSGLVFASGLIPLLALGGAG